MDCLIDVYLHWVEDGIQFSQDRKTPFKPAQIVQTEYHAVKKTGIYSLSLKDYRKKAILDKTWSRFKKI